MARPVCFDLIDKILGEVGLIKQQEQDRADHEDELFGSLSAIEDIGEEYEMMENGPHSDQSFCGLYHNNELIKSVVMYRRNK